MKKLVSLCLVLMLAATASFAKEKVEGCTSKTTPTGNITFFGIDYSYVRFAYITEAKEYALRILPEINRMFTAEAQKYDAAKYMKKMVVKEDYDYTNAIISKLSADKLIADNGDYQISADDVKTAVSKYPASTEDGVGLVFIAELMNKKAGEGTYYVTFFDLKTKAVLTTCRVAGKARGFGFRNYWAASIYNLMKNWK